MKIKMKKILFILGLATVSLVSAQTEMGNYVLETAVLSNNTTPNTGLGYTSVDGGSKVFNVGLNGGYFVGNNLALKAGVGYGEVKDVVQTWSFRTGAEYHIVGRVPVELAWTGSSTKGAADNPSYLSTQIGYNWFVSKNFGVKPLFRYDFSLKDSYQDVTSVGVGFGYYF